MSDFKWTSSMALYRGLDDVTPKTFKKDQSVAEDDNALYGPGAYFHEELGYNGALQWISKKGMVVKYKPKKTLILLEYKKPIKRQKDLMGDLDDKYDGVYLSHPHQEAGIQIILRDGSKVKPIGYWPVAFKYTKHGETLPVYLPANKMKRKFAASINQDVILAALRAISG